MANFIDQLSTRVVENRSALLDRYHHGELQFSDRLRAVAQKHWHAPLPRRQPGSRRPAYAIDGSNRRANLSNGATLFVAQGLMVGEGLDQTIADIEILPGTVDSDKIDRFADLMRQNLEIKLAHDYSPQIPSGSILYLDGALYGTLSQLFPLKGVPRDFAQDLMTNYGELFAECRRRDIALISIAKTNRQPLFSSILQKFEGIEPVQEISDSAFFDQWTDRRAGYATPLLLGRHSFSEGDRSTVLDATTLKNAPAIVSFFIRFGDYEEPLRIDVPAFCIGRNEHVSDLEEALIDCASVEPIVHLLLEDYGGIEVYNALAYIVDQEVRLSKDKMYDIYLPLVGDILGEQLRPDRSERRFIA